MDSELLEIYTGWFVRIFALQLCTFFSSVSIPMLFESNPQREEFSYQTACCSLVCALASDLECNIVGRVALDLECCCRQVVEVLAEQL